MQELPNYGVFLAGRFISGLGVGATSLEVQIAPSVFSLH